MKCPRCAAVLSSAELDNVNVDVCPKCKGEWLFAGELLRIVEHHNEVFSPEEIAAQDAVNKEILTAEKDDQDELNCPACVNVRMEHFNYGDTSGIILHKCTQCEGIWMDKNQLERIEEVVDGWKADLNQDVKKYASTLKKIAIEEQKELDQDVSISRFGFVNSVLRQFCE